MTDFINNSWTVSIGSSIVSGLIVYFITAYVATRRKDNEYLQRVITANNELLYIIRPFVVQKDLPEISMFEIIIKSTANKYKVKDIDLLGVSNIADDLIMEVMSNVFLTIDQKKEFCNKIKLLKSDFIQTEIFREFKTLREEVLDKGSVFEILPYIISIITAITTGLLVYEMPDPMIFTVFLTLGFPLILGIITGFRFGGKQKDKIKEKFSKDLKNSEDNNFLQTF